MAVFGGNHEKGKELYVQKCALCHALQAGAKNKVGPNLHGIFGRKAGQAPGFNFSEANKNIGIIWNQSNLSEFLENPKTFMPGTKMVFPGLKQSDERTDLIAYLMQATT